MAKSARRPAMTTEEFVELIFDKGKAIAFIEAVEKLLDEQEVENGKN